jgi:hypothetical protein
MAHLNGGANHKNSPFRTTEKLFEKVAYLKHFSAKVNPGFLRGGLRPALSIVIRPDAAGDARIVSWWDANAVHYE